jgi:DNA-binding MarR family transcriptional regulator
MTHPTVQIDDVIHQRVRLGILAMLVEADAADFTFLRDSLELTDGNLSRHLQVLEDAGLVTIKKRFEGKKPRTWVRATKKGRSALAGHLRTLKALIDQVGGGQ